MVQPGESEADDRRSGGSGQDNPAYIERYDLVRILGFGGDIMHWLNPGLYRVHPVSKRLFWFGRCTETYRFSMSPWCSNSLKRRGFTCQPYIGRLGEYQVRVSLFAGHYCKWRSSGPGGSSGKLHGYDSGGLPSNRSRGTPQRIPATVVWFRNLS